MEHKGKADTDDVETNDLQAGDFVELEIGDWNGMGFSYQACGNVKQPAYVVEAFDDKAVMVFKDDRCDWSMEGDEALEFTVNTDGTMEGVDIPTYNTPRVKEYNVVEHRGGYHKVRFGIEKTRNQ